jgi:hypothetical protein
VSIKRSSNAFLALIFIATFSLSLLHWSSKVAADPDTDVTVSVQPTCISSASIDGEANATYIDVAPNSNLNLVVTNSDGVVAQSITGTGIASGTEVEPNSKTTTNQTTVSLSLATTSVTVTFTPIPSSDSGAVSPNNCPTSSTTTPTPTTPSSIVINPVSVTTFSCYLTGSTWDLIGNLNGSIAGDPAIYNGSNNQASIISSGSFNVPIPASSTAQTFSLIDGANFGGKGTTLASVTCTGHPTTSPATVSPSPTATPSATPIDSAYSSNGNSSNTNTPQTLNSEKTSLNTGDVIALIVVIVVVLILIIIGLWLAGIWDAPIVLIKKLFHKFSKTPKKDEKTPKVSTKTKRFKKLRRK